MEPTGGSRPDHTELVNQGGLPPEVHARLGEFPRRMIAPMERKPADYSHSIRRAEVDRGRVWVWTWEGSLDSRGPCRGPGEWSIWKRSAVAANEREAIYRAGPCSLPSGRFVT
jgi:hypothetical protein